MHGVGITVEHAVQGKVVEAAPAFANRSLRRGLVEVVEFFLFTLLFGFGFCYLSLDCQLSSLEFPKRLLPVRIMFAPDSCVDFVMKKPFLVLCRAFFLP